MGNKGFVSLLALIWFSAVILFLNSALTTMRQYLITYENLKYLEDRSLIEWQVVGKTRQL